MRDPHAIPIPDHRPPPPALRTLVRVLPVARTETRDGLAVTLLALERYDNGFVLQCVLQTGDRATGMPDPHPVVADDCGNRYTAWGGGGGGSGAHQGEWRCAFNCVPALDPAARAVTVAIPDLPFLTGDDATRPGPWTFTVPLDEVAIARVADAPAAKVRAATVRSRAGDPVLDALVDVIAVGQTQTRDAVTLTLASVERYREGWLAQFGVVRTDIVHLPQFPLTATDARGTRDTATRRGAAGGGSATRFHWRCAYAFAPALPTDAVTIRLHIANDPAAHCCGEWRGSAGTPCGYERGDDGSGDAAGAVGIRGALPRAVRVRDSTIAAHRDAY